MQRVNNSTATPGGYSETGDTTAASAIISNLASTTGISIGDYIISSAGFPDVGKIRIIGKTSNTLTADINANASVAGITVDSQSNMYTDGKAGSVARTILNSKYMNLIQEEIANLIEAKGIALSGTDSKQLVELFTTIFGSDIFANTMQIQKVVTDFIESGYAGPINIISDILAMAGITIGNAGLFNDNGIVSRFRGSDTDVTGDDLEVLTGSPSNNASGLHTHSELGDIRKVASGLAVGFQNGDEATYVDLSISRFLGSGHAIDNRRIYSNAAGIVRAVHPSNLNFARKTGDDRIYWELNNVESSGMSGSTRILAVEEDGIMVIDQDIPAGIAPGLLTGDFSITGVSVGKRIEFYFVITMDPSASGVSPVLVLYGPRAWVS